MKSLTVINPTSKIEHEITFSTRPASSGKIVIRQDGRAIGKINIASKLVFCEKTEVYKAVSQNVDSIINETKKPNGSKLG